MPKPSAINREAASSLKADSTDSHWSRLVGPFIGPLCIVVLMATVLSGRDRLAFRDVSHFYTPLYQYVGERCAERPLTFFWSAMWNPLDQTGMPLAGETTTAVYYPVRHLIYSIPLLVDRSTNETASPNDLPEDASLALAWYVTLHLILASLSAYWAARYLGCKPACSTIASLAYPLSGSVLFLATNPPFLVGAAWLPFALVPLVHSKARGWKLLSIAMAMMVLGGDPQTAFHVGIVAGLWLIFDVIRNRGDRKWWPSLLLRALRMFGIAATATVLAAPQIWASVNWARHSGRVWSELNETQSFAFSIAPWRWLELLMPSLFGSPWPVNHRWDRPLFLGGDLSPVDALWTPSLYIGLSTLVLVALSLRGSYQDRFRGTGLWCFVLLGSSLAAMGWYGPWHVPYQWLVDWVPGYDAFRYPAKWLPFGTFALAMMAALGGQRVLRSLSETSVPNKVFANGVWQAAWFWLSVTLASVLASVGVWSAMASVKSAPIDAVWGPFQTDVAWYGWLACVAHVWIIATTIIAMGLCWKALVVRRTVSWVWVALIACDLMVAHWNLVPTINRNAERQAWQELNHVASNTAEVDRWIRTAGEGEYPLDWATTSDAQRLLAMEVHDRRRWYGRWHLTQKESVFNSIVSIRPWAIDQFWNTVRDRDDPIDWQQTAAWLGVGGSRTSDGHSHVWRTSGLRFHPYNQVVTESNVPWPVRIETASESGEQIDLIAVGSSTMSAGAIDDTFVSRRVYQDGGWRAELISQDRSIETIPGTVFNADGVAQGVWCPPGSWTIRWIYSPPGHNVAVIVWMLGGLIIAILTINSFIRMWFTQSIPGRMTGSAS
ncbi:YfhO family protein [Rhodopirellula bahusiensis]|uniref:YfhO family protein n=1 Tax=Rhodopirellula bahusiensis TaxID=2014065 RepID=UPI003298E63C